MKSEAAYDAVFQALVDIRNDLHDKINLLDEQIRRAQLEGLDNVFQQQKEAFAECVDGIDEQLVKLSVYFEEYQRLYASLRELNEKRIPELRGTPPVMPDAVAGDTLAAVLAGRLEYLKSQGKIRDL